MTGTILLTGATGFLGTYITQWILKNTDLDIIVLVRAKNMQEALYRLSRGWWDFPELIGAIEDRIQVVKGNITESGLGLEDVIYDELVSRLTHIIHMAANVSICASLDELRMTNVQGTKNVLELARKVHLDHGLIRFSHVSTAYVAGGRRGEIHENTLTDEYGFLSPYEVSKYESELLVQAAKVEFPISVFRPGMIVGDSHTGYIKTFNTLYFPVRLYMTGRLKVLPLSSSQRINLIPVDYVTDAVARLTFDPRAEGMNFHLTAPFESLPAAGELIGYVREWTRERLGITLSRPLFLPIPDSLLLRWFRIQKVFRIKQKGILDALIPLVPYFNERRRYMRDNTDRLLGCYEMEWRAIMPNLLEFSVYTGFMHRTERSVHEQIIFRQKSKSRPVTYHDVVKGKIVTRDTAEVRKNILAAVKALYSMNVCPEDRIAIVGLNSTRFLTIDVAIGLIGAVSVPLYYTCPLADIDEIIKNSNSRLLFVGSYKLIEKVEELTVTIPVISFCQDSLPQELHDKVISWNDFLAKGENSGEMRLDAPIALYNTATLRYTSGTTGRPKGAIFRHDNLRWMAESLASLIPWKTRNEKISYLSFLPMNHVVEGILTMYSPYYIPAPLNIYFLEDFHDLQDALPRVKPTIFFSVPRFYEKVWEKILNSGIGCQYLRLHKGLMKKIFRYILRWVILRKIGLERCTQLIMGSAPASENLFKSFRELGIEIHNAYGLTEAPLVTLNRFGANRLGTVGEPLPNTLVHIADDGEILVRGPQVTSGYYGGGVEQPFREGWLQTGDYGYLTGEGSLVISGRKSELIVTSYGKNIYPVKIEMMLQEITNISVVMLIGDSRPYCVSLLWVKQNLCTEFSPEATDNAIKEVNTRLSHPEQVKRWAILNDDLSIEGGDLTANLKIKRKALTGRFKDVIDALYDERELPEYVLHYGRTEKG
ncbi:AMP-binding protein [bacterium]|nr:AMP-binding protein [bacterium]